jgi:multisubunit Na+/H+ antiporter MnhB subunit
MTLWRASFIVVAAVAVVIACLLVVRRRAPIGGYFADSTRAGSVFSVLARGVTVLLAFVIFLALQTFRTASDTAGEEAVATTQLYRTTALLPDPGGSDLRGDLVCYARSVVADEWHTMSAGRESSTVQGWLDRMTSSLASISPENQGETTAYAEWFDQDAQRREGRRGRLAQAEGFVPSLLWIVLVVGALLVIVYMLLFSDPKERGPVQAFMVGGVTAVIVSALVVVAFLDSPYGEHTGSIHPTEMQRTLRLMEQTRSPSFASVRVPCDARGAPEDAAT